MASTLVHIYPLSRLVHASPANWEKQLQEIERGKDSRYGYYLPLREAVVSYCKSRRKRRDDIVKILENQARSVFAFRGADLVRDNISAFEVFEVQFYPRIAKFERSLLRADSNGGCDFAGLRLLGTPHFSVKDDLREETRYVYLHASKWPEDDLKAYLELLAVVVAAKYQRPPIASGAWTSEQVKTISGAVPRVFVEDARARLSFTRGS